MVIKMTKIDIISGFLGAGKTTLIKKLLQEALKGSKTVLIENEFGEVGIDGGFLKELSQDKNSGFEVREMNSGCICCSLSGDFATSLKEVLNQYHPERIIIEPSGVGKLSDVISAVRTVADGEEIVLNSCITVVDAGRCKMYLKNFGEFFANQVAYAETIILSKTDKISEEKLANCVTLLREHNQTAKIVSTPWNQIDGSFLIEQMEKQFDFEKETLEETVLQHKHENEHHHHKHDEDCGCHEHGHHHHHEHEENCGCGCHDHEHHHAEEVFKSWGMETPLSYEHNRIAHILDALENEKEYGLVLRAKGMIPGQNGEWIHFDYVPGEADIRCGSPDLIGKICVIGSKLKEENLNRLFQE